MRDTWYLLNGECGKDARPIDPADWHWCRYWRIMGQRGRISCTTLLDMRYEFASIVGSPLGQFDGMASAHRASRILGHIDGVLPTSIPASLIPRPFWNKGKGEGKGQGKGLRALSCIGLFNSNEDAVSSWHHLVSAVL